MTLEEAITLAVLCLSKVIEGKVEPSKVKIAVVPAETRKFRLLSREEVENYLKKV